MEMKVEKAAYIFVDQVPTLLLEINGKETIIADFKFSILELGYVPLSSRDSRIDWSKLLPPVTLPATEERHEVTLRGFTKDPVIVEMAREFWKAINWIDGRKFKEGPVDIPDKNSLNLTLDKNGRS